ncbi:inorganic phosphate transporter [Fontisphaera persica]|uniref:inorganic phosphate transporter n=1 Tax=Fontisphaera persica TaxID=2974023 RepID=UPI0024C0D3F6|nr:inorganic phosphate transporter [Fontisphaera persica]WCJ59218.1 inorganic phosphate transporter [Fontisphaera persica]
MELVIVVILVALIFEYINGFHDTANSIATVVSTKVLTPRQAVIMAALANLGGAMLGTAVAKTISSGLIDSKVVTVTSEMLVCALLGGITWNLITWWFGMPSSSSHALIGGLCGAALAGAKGNWQAIIWSQPNPSDWLKSGGLLYKVVIPMFSSPLGGFVLGFLIMGLLYLLVTLLRLTPRIVNLTFGKAQILSAAAMGVMHGTNDAQKTMGIIALALMAATTAGTFDQLPRYLNWLYYPTTTPVVYEAFNQLGEMARDGQGLPQNLPHAASDFKHAAEKNNANAQYNLALLYLEGRGVEVNYRLAAEWLERAAKNQHRQAREKLAELYQKGMGVPKDEARAAALLENLPPPSPPFTIPRRKLDGQPAVEAEALAWLQARVARNNAEAQSVLAAWYWHGVGGLPQDRAQAVRLWQQSAQRNHPEALYCLGVLHRHGVELPQDLPQAVRYFHRAAKMEGIKLWIKVVCAITMAAGTAAGGWRIIKTLGHKMVKLQPINGFAAETSSATMIFLATTLGIPVSTTHNISAAIMGVGCARRFNALRWTVVERMVWAWVLTIPISGGLGYLLCRLGQWAGWIQ